MATGPVLSSDGNRVAFVSETENDTKIIGLYVMKADGSGRRRMAERANGTMALAPAWSPDGKRIAFCTVVADNKRWFASPKLYVIDVDGGHLEHLTGLEGLFPSWSTDGKRLLFTHLNEAHPWSLYSIELDSKALQPLVKDGALMGSWSPDGKWLAYIIDSMGLYVAKTDGSNPKRLRAVAGEEMLCPQWSRDSRRLYFTGRAGDSSAGVYAIDISGQNFRRLSPPKATETLGGDSALCESPRSANVWRSFGARCAAVIGLEYIHVWPSSRL
jgi:Tol biopolymer transport system component